MTGTPATVHALIEAGAAHHADAVYAVAADGSQSMTFGELRADCLRVDRALESLGVRPGQTISFVMPNGLQTLRLLLGALHAGRCVNPVNLLAQPEQMRYVLEHSDCSLVVVAPEWAERVHAAIADIGRDIALLVVAPDGDAAALIAALPADASGPSAPGTGAARAPAGEETALLMYTSGTTGVPKGVMLSQANLAANAAAICREHGLGADDRVLGVLPLYHINAFLVTMLAPLASGGSVVVVPRFSAAQFWTQAIDRRCTWINVVPTIISYLIEGDVPPRASLARLRFCRSASAALPIEHHRAFEAKFGIGIVETMGLTETAAPSFSNPIAAHERRLGSVGRASGGEARVVDARQAPLSDGQTGEIVIRGPHVMRGYYKNEEATRASFTADGWLRTGDLGHREGDGFFFVTGRIKELIIKGGENIAPREIDEVLLAHPAVLDAAAVGMPDRHYGQDILACVVLREGVTCDAGTLMAFCNERLGRFKTPREVRFVTSLPRGPSGKVQRLKLLDAG